eukprot:CAMPEP_0195538812 /NCGR_PEP_ID=MMETSP0794_2-20130614/49729_1 /TAXON_ID=515487 /ORGANISM="Stephanopyxis turris, Strain CCMP 815" /LENGTH=981 /DNA_ID=CAMNT_0040672821 /DNA_START=213 /DNA_END=3155 /DNA_ORIENTATION=+
MKSDAFNSFMVMQDALRNDIDEAEKRLLSEQVCPSLVDDLENVSITTFLTRFEDELRRITEFIFNQQLSLESLTKAMLSNIDVTFKRDANSAETADSVLKLRKEADNIARLSISLDAFTKCNSGKLRAIVAEADQRLGTSCLTLVNHKLSLPPWTRGPSTFVLTALSDIHAILHEAEEEEEEKECRTNEGEKGKAWVAPSTFERSTHKYWVEDEKLAEVLHAAVSEVPLLVYGRSGRLTKMENNYAAELSLGEKNTPEVERLWDNLATPITSVYFDSPDLGLYRERIARKEGAKLLRVRWYGEKPQGDELLFLELKTHHESWVDMKSIKERVSIRERDMTSLFDTEKKWGLKEAEAVVLAANHMKDEALTEAALLLLDMQDLIDKMKLRPCVRTMYLRAAFQSHQSNSLRLTLDRSITVINERHAPPGAWCTPDISSINVNSIARVPYSVLEVKLAGSETPSTIENLITSGAIIDGAKFSKFLTGAATFNSDKIETLPYWAALPTFSSMFKNNFSSSELNTLDSDSDSDAGRGITSNLLNSQVLMNNVHVQNERQTHKKGQCFPVCVNYFKGIDDELKIAPRTPTKVEPKTYFANERTFIQWLSAAMMLVTISLILFGIQSASEFTKTVGFVLNILAICVAIYGLAMYFYRLRLMERGDPYGYTNHSGPIVLTLSVISGIVILLFFYNPIPPPTSTAHSMAVAQGCTKHDLSGMPRLEYQPSDTIVDAEKGLLLIPSQSLITALPIGQSKDTGVVTLAELPGHNFKSLTYVGELIYAISVNNSLGTSYLVAFKWNDLENKLVSIGGWEIPIAKCGGMAYVPDESGGKLYIAGGKTKRDLFVYKVPKIDSSAPLMAASCLNHKLMTKGLGDNTIGSLTYFEGILYVLHNGDNLVRAWNLTTGTIFSELELPNAGTGVDVVWSGIALERMNTSVTRSEHAYPHVMQNTRGGWTSLEQQRSDLITSDQSTLVLYLSLDTPAEVW